MNRENAIKITAIFFSRRFENKQFEFFYTTDTYFEEWIRRFMSDEPERWMDNKSFAVWIKIKDQLKL
ncbi:MAG: hypothetical protein GY853_16645 [PVC group bacterium]|nr:hypothetical protein [PVC group bacterium]